MSRRTQPLSPFETALQRPTSDTIVRASSNGVPRPIESPHRPAAPPPAGSLTAATTQFASGSGEHARVPIEAAETMQFAAAVTKPMAANALGDFGAERTSTNLIATSAAILACAAQHAIYDSYETSSDPAAKSVDDASTRLHKKNAPAAVATGVMRPNARVVFPAMPAVQLANGTSPPTSRSSDTPAPLPPAPSGPTTLPPEARTAFLPAQQPQVGAPQAIASHPSSGSGQTSNPAARTVIEPQPILAAARPAFPLPATQFERPGVRARSPSTPASLRDDKSRVAPRDSSADVQRAVQAALDKRRAFIAETFRGGTARGAIEDPTMYAYEREASTALLYMLLAVLTCVLAPVAWIHAEEQLLRSNALVFRIERAVGLALTLAAVAAIACGITVLLVR
ncbi:MAG TPA: hypothetical protein VGM90_02260 [Kofleriaceae bacterium]|jgi:hypothetical protein